MQIAATTGIAALQQVAKTLGNVAGDNKSLVEYTSVARVEPITLIDGTCLYMDMLPDVMQSLQSIFSGYYLQAFALSTHVGSIDVVKQLERFNPNRSAGSAVGQQLGTAISNYAQESLDDYTHRLPVMGDPRNAKPAMEASVIQDSVNAVTELANLSVGKLLNVEIIEGDKKAVIPVSIRLLANSITPDSLIHILSAGSKEVSLNERWYQWKSGQIEFFRDLVFCQDLIDEHKKHLMDDKDGLYDAILRRRTENKIAGVVSGNYSVASASNLCVISKDTATKLELNTNSSLKNFKARQKIFENTYMMLMAVIDPEWDRVTFYHRGIPEATTLSHRDLKTANKNNGPDIKDILTAYRAGSAPGL